MTSAAAAMPAEAACFGAINRGKRSIARGLQDRRWSNALP